MTMYAGWMRLKLCGCPAEASSSPWTALKQAQVDRPRCKEPWSLKSASISSCQLALTTWQETTLLINKPASPVANLHCNPFPFAANIVPRPLVATSSPFPLSFLCPLHYLPQQHCFHCLGQTRISVRLMPTLHLPNHIQEGRPPAPCVPHRRMAGLHLAPSGTQSKSGQITHVMSYLTSCEPGKL